MDMVKCDFLVLTPKLKISDVRYVPVAALMSSFELRINTVVVYTDLCMHNEL